VFFVVSLFSYLEWRKCITCSCLIWPFKGCARTCASWCKSGSQK